MLGSTTLIKERTKRGKAFNRASYFAKGPGTEEGRRWFVSYPFRLGDMLITGPTLPMGATKKKDVWGRGYGGKERRTAGPMVSVSTKWGSSPFGKREGRTKWTEKMTGGKKKRSIGTISIRKKRGTRKAVEKHPARDPIP